MQGEIQSPEKKQNNNNSNERHSSLLSFLFLFLSLPLLLFSLLRIGCHRHQDEFSWFPAAPSTFSPETDTERCSFSSSHVMKFKMSLNVCVCEYARALLPFHTKVPLLIDTFLFSEGERGRRRQLAWPRVERCHQRRFFSGIAFLLPPIIVSFLRSVLQV